MIDTATQQRPDEKLETGYKAIEAHFNSAEIRKKFEDILGNGAQGFIRSVLFIVDGDKELQKSDFESLVGAAEMAALLNLPLNNHLQFAHIVANVDQVSGIVAAEFQIGWRGLVQLGLRTGKFATINVTDVREGELRSQDRMTGEFTFVWEQDDKVRNDLKVIGYMSYFKLLTGFEKCIYRTVEELNLHAATYSKTYANEKGRWKTNFPAMANKTTLKENLQKWAPLSVEMAQAIQADQGIIKSIDNGEIKVNYKDNPQSEAPALTPEEFAEIERKTKEFQSTQAVDHLSQVLAGNKNNATQSKRRGKK